MGSMYCNVLLPEECCHHRKQDLLGWALHSLPALTASLFETDELGWKARALGCGWGQDRQGLLLATMEVCPDYNDPGEVLGCNI